MQITFPKKEWSDIKKRLNENKIVYTIRVGNEYGKYKVENILKTEWGDNIKILLVKKVSGGLEELQKEYKFFNQLTEEMIQELSPFKDMEIISLIKI
jgi:hypothetical protein